MASPIHVPRVNNNDDTVQIVGLAVKEGDFVRKDQTVGSVETDKAVVDVQAERDGYVLRILGRVDDRASVGSVLMWLGETADEAAPDTVEPPTGSTSAGGIVPTAKARAMLRSLGLDAREIPSAGDRLTVRDIEAWLAANGRIPAVSRSGSPAQAVMARRSTLAAGGTAEPMPQVEGEFHDLSLEARGMLTTVLWHRDHAVPGYVEIEYDPQPWDEHAARYAAGGKLMLSPLMPLVAYRLVQLAKTTPSINATIVDGQRYQFTPVNLGFTVQSGSTLYLTVVRGAQAMDTTGFIAAMGEVQRHAMAHKLRAEELSGATLSFSSMARWNVSRHMPVLPPQTAMIVAHAAPRGSGKAVLGATYDHRLLTGFDVIRVLQALAQPPEEPGMEKR